MSRFERKVPSMAVPQRLDIYLTRALEGKYSRQELKRALDSGRFTLNGKPVKPKTLVSEGDVIAGDLPDIPPSSRIEPETIPLRILYEDEALIAVDKPAGMVVHPGAGVRHGTLVHALVGRGGTLSSAGGNLRPGIVHRLDKDTSGVLVVARNNEAHRKIQSQFESRSLSKTYLALVKGRVEYEEGHVSESIGAHPRARRKRAVSKRVDAREAETRYRVLKRFKYSTLLEIRILTGRTHQIRVHMAHVGHPVIGDALYGAKGNAPRLGLHALKLELRHPKTGKLIAFESPIPEEFQAMIEQAKNQ